MANPTQPDLMPIGRFAGRPIFELRTAYLCWWLSQDHLRFKYRETMGSVLAELTRRFADPESLVAELTPSAPTPEYWLRRESTAKGRRKKDARLRVEIARRRAQAQTAPFEPGPFDGSDLL